MIYFCFWGNRLFLMILLLIIRQDIIEFRNYCSLLTSLLLILPAFHVYTISFYFLIHLINAGVRVLILDLLALCILSNSIFLLHSLLYCLFLSHLNLSILVLRTLSIHNTQPISFLFFSFIHCLHHFIIYH